MRKWLPMLKKNRDSGGSGDWITIYADMVTLLLCFFVLLYSFSAIDNEKFRQFISSFQGKSILDGGEVVLPGPDTDFPIDEWEGDEDPYWADSERLLEYVKRYLVEHGIDGSIEVNRDERGVQLQMPDHLFFNSGEARITSRGLNILENLTPLFEEIPNKVLVEGHTDTRPMNSIAFPSNWELSCGRAASVVRYFTEDMGLVPKRFIAVGYGEFHPVESNATSEGRAANRRVVMVIRSN